MRPPVERHGFKGHWVPDGLHTVSQAAQLLQLSTRTLWRELAAGNLVSVRLSKRAVRISGAELRRYIWQMTETPD